MCCVVTEIDVNLGLVILLCHKGCGIDEGWESGWSPDRRMTGREIDHQSKCGNIT